MAVRILWNGTLMKNLALYMFWNFKYYNSYTFRYP